MSGSKLQIAIHSTKRNDDYMNISEKPNMTFFKSVYKQHSLFAKEFVKFIPKTSIKKGGKLSFKIPVKFADLLYKSYLYLSSTDSNWNLYDSTKTQLSYSFIESISLYINGVLVDFYDSVFNEIYNRINVTKEKYQDVLSQTMYIPLNFFFCKNSGSVLPLCSLKESNDIQIVIQLSSYHTIPQNLTIDLWCNVIYLAEEERNRFINDSRKMLIETIQNTSKQFINGTNNPKFHINFTRPVKEIYWMFLSEDIDNIKIRNTKKTEQTTILFNSNIERVSNQYYQYFRYLQTYENHISIYPQDIFSFSFDLNPGSSQPSGHCNFSLLTNNYILVNNLDFVIKTSPIYFIGYAVSYNILNIKNGNINLITV